MEEYTFKYQNNKGGMYVLLAFFGVLPVILWLSAVLIDYIPWIFWLSIPLMIGFMVWCIRRFNKISRDVDSIVVDDLGFTSKSYGRVLYTDIHSIPPYGPLQAEPPSMRIKLHNGKKLVWIFNPRNDKAKDDIATFTAFREELLACLKQQVQMPMSEIPETQKGLEPITENTARFTEKEDPSQEVIEQLEKHKKRDVNFKYITIPVGFAVAIMMFARTCGEDLIQEHRKKEFAGVRNAVLRMETDYEDNLRKAKRVADEYSLRFGTVFLLTNDPQGEVEFSPEISQNSFEPSTNIVGLRRAEDNKELEAFIQNPDSATYRLAVNNPVKGFYTVMHKSVFGNVEDDETLTVYLAVYNLYEELPPSFPVESDADFSPIEYSTSISIPKEGHLTKEILENMDFASARSILQKYENTYFYMVAKEQDGISAERFAELRRLVEANFEERGISVAYFHTERFNAEW